MEMDQNKLRDIVQAITSGELVDLNLNGRQPSDEDLKILALALESKNSIVQKVVLDYNDLTIIDGDYSGLRSFAQALGSNKQLICLCLSNTNLNDDLFSQFVKLITTQGILSLRYLMLSHNKLTAAAIKDCCELVKKCPNLQILDLSENALGDGGCIMLSDLISDCQNLRCLYISKIGITNIGLHAITAALEFHSKIQTLDAGENEIGDVGAFAVAGLISSSNSLQVVFLDSSNITNFGAKAIFKSIKNSTMRIISLSGNELSSVEGLAEVIAENSTIEQILLSNNKLNCKAVSPAFCNLHKNHVLYTFDLEDNQISDEAVYTLVKFLPANFGLKTLDLSRNCITLRAAKSLLKATVNHQTLDCLILGSNIFLANEITEFLNAHTKKRIKYIIEDGSEDDSDDKSVMTTITPSRAFSRNEILYAEPISEADANLKSAPTAPPETVSLGLSI